MLICEIKRKEEMPTVPFQKITEACKTTGLSQYFRAKAAKTARCRTSRAVACTTSTSRS